MHKKKNTHTHTNKILIISSGEIKEKRTNFFSFCKTKKKENNKKKTTWVKVRLLIFPVDKKPKCLFVENCLHSDLKYRLHVVCFKYDFYFFYLWEELLFFVLCWVEMCWCLCFFVGMHNLMVVSVVPTATMTQNCTAILTLLSREKHQSTSQEPNFSRSSVLTVLYWKTLLPAVNKNNDQRVSVCTCVSPETHIESMDMLFDWERKNIIKK